MAGGLVGTEVRCAFIILCLHEKGYIPQIHDSNKRDGNQLPSSSLRQTIVPWTVRHHPLTLTETLQQHHRTVNVLDFTANNDSNRDLWSRFQGHIRGMIKADGVILGT
jgi:hypothetical protein